MGERLRHRWAPVLPIPPGTPFSEREAVVHRGLLRANGYDAAPPGYRRATASSEPTLRAAAFALLARDPAAEDLARFAQGAADPDPAVRAFAAFGLEQLLVDDRHLACLLRQYQSYFNESRPHQGLGQRIPADPVLVIDPSKPIAVKSVLGGLHVDYRRAT